MNKNLIIIGVILLLLGLFWPLIAKLSLGRLPGDIIIRKENMSFYFPVTTCLVISIIISLIFWFFKK